MRHLLVALLIGFAVNLIVFCIGLFVLGFANVKHLLPEDPVVKATLFAFGTGGLGAFAGVIAASAWSRGDKRATAFRVALFLIIIDLAYQLYGFTSGSPHSFSAVFIHCLPSFLGAGLACIMARARY